MRALIANEPRVYREVLVDALQEFRPHVEISTVEPEGIDAEVERLCPHLVVSSRVSTVAPAGPLTWVMLYPNGENWAEIVMAGERVTITGTGFGDLLSIIDSTELLCRLA
jgi:hypothetical protein